MALVNPSMRLKVQGDTFFLPEPGVGVYFRNNRVSFRMEGKTVDQWIEKLMPMFDGGHTMGELTNGLTDPYRDRVYEIADSLYQNGFVRDISQDRPHQLPENIVRKYGPQIEYLDNIGGSGAYRFQKFRQTGVLAAGSGPMLVSLVAALLEAGLPRLHLFITDAQPTNRQRISELAAHARRDDAAVEIAEFAPDKIGTDRWSEAHLPFDAIAYVSQEGDVGMLRQLHEVCKRTGKMFMPALIVRQAGMAGPLEHPESDGDWESAWRRVHRSAIEKDPDRHGYSATGGAMLANVVAFELLQAAARVTKPDGHKKLFLLDLETLEGSWHPFLPHPMATSRPVAAIVRDVEQRILQGADSAGNNASLLPYFGRLTSAETGIFHVWDEGDLLQLPLSVCRVQAADPLSEGPAELLPDIVVAGMTHEDARREAGLAGIEAYVSRLASPLVSKLPGFREQSFGVGAGATPAEAVSRGLQRILDGELRVRHAGRPPTAYRVPSPAVEDKMSQYCIRTLTILGQQPLIGIGEPLSGLPVVWVGAGGRWVGSAGLNVTLALRRSLTDALLKAQLGRTGEGAASYVRAVEAEAVMVESRPSHANVRFPACEDIRHPETLRSAMQTLRQSGRQLLVLDLSLEPHLKTELAGAFGVVLGEGGRE